MEPKVTGYITANAGYIQNAAKDNIGVITGGAGVKAESDKYEFFAEGGYGNAVYTKAEGGAKFPFQESNFGVKTSVGVQYAQLTKSRDYYKNIFEEGANSPSWKPNDLRGYGQVALTYNTPSFKASVGIRGGVKTCTQAPLDGVNLAPVGNIEGTEYAGRTTKGFVSPVIELEAGKKVCLSLKTSLLDDISIGGKIYF